MRYVSPGRWKAALLLFAAWGIAVGAAATPMQVIAQRQFGRGGIGIALAVNVLLPLGAFLIAIWYPRFRLAVAGGLLVGLGFMLERVVEFNPAFWEWSLKFVEVRTHPVAVAASIGCGVVAAIGVLLAKPFRKVGLADQHLRCAGCGYLMTGLPASTCPECGKATMPASA